MIEIPEDTILNEISDLLLNELPKVLLELEEQTEDGGKLSPFRYAGLPEKLPPGTSMPYALVGVEEGTYSEKDRIVKNRIYQVVITIKAVSEEFLWQYLFGIERVIAGDQTMLRMKIVEKKRSGTMQLRVTWLDTSAFRLE